jgi:ATP/ADP translocase
VKNKEFEVPESLSKYLMVLAIVVVAYGVVRNLPLDELYWMRP